MTPLPALQRSCCACDRSCVAFARPTTGAALSDGGVGVALLLRGLTENGVTG